jgi:uncharacterized membrane protein YcgQ (UPF0703/DUF1980 family)
VMTKTKNEAYMDQFTPEQISYFYSLPLWVNTCWAVAVWSALLGSILLLLRMKLAVAMFALSFITLLATLVQNYVLAEVKMSDVTGQTSLVLEGIIFVIALMLWVYSHMLRRRGLVR